MNKLNAFIGYAPEDEKYLRELEIFIKPLPINAWHEGKIMAGKLIDQEVKRHLQQADIILLLISANFLANDKIYDEVLIAAQQRHDQGSAVVMPIILRPCLWKHTPFNELKHLPADEKPVLRAGGDVDALFCEIAEALQGIINDKFAPNKIMPRLNQEKKPALGSHVHKLCDREPQNFSFRNNFMPKINGGKTPHAFIIYGNQNQRHHSLHDVFNVKTIKKIIEGKYGLKESVATHKKNTPIVILKNNLQQSQNAFKANLSCELEVFDRIFQSGSELVHWEGWQKYKVVLISHDILQQHWHNTLTPDFLRWYINEFWNFEPKVDIPQIIVVINVLWNDNNATQIATLQQQLCALDNENCTVLDELEDVTQGDVISWLNDYNLRDFCSPTDLIKDVFGGRDNTNMGQVEDKLLNFLNQLK